MSQTPFVELLLTCGSWQEAQAIADQLLEQKLVACVEFIEVQSKFHWQGDIHDNKEIKLIMQSATHLFDEIEKEVSKLHSYETFVLQQLPITNISNKAEKWLTTSLAK